MDQIYTNYFYRPQTKFGQGNIFTPVCHSVHGGRGCVGRGLCVIAARWHTWLLGGACVVAGGHAWLPGGCAWLEGVHGCQGACVVAGGHAWLRGGGGVRGCCGACVLGLGIP